jgi:hypothetical protein
MNSFADHQQPVLEPDVFVPQTQAPEIFFAQERRAWDPIGFGEEQIRSLVSQVFLPGRPKPARQVVFSAVDFDTNVATICMQVAQVLSEQVSGSVCVMQSNFQERPARSIGEGFHGRAFGELKFASLRNSSRRLSDNLWLVPPDIFAAESGSGFSTQPLSVRVSELRLDFDYAVLCGPPVGKCAEGALLGHLCDGVVLVVDAHSTRRVAAQKAKEAIYAANARLLGVVLNGRTFPIPDGIYRKL